MKLLRRVLILTAAVMLVVFLSGTILLRSPGAFFDWAADVIVFDSEDAGICADTAFAYGTLSEREREIYAKIYVSMRDFDDSTYVKAADDGELKRVYYAIMQDNPQIFWVDKLTSSQISVGSQTVFTLVNFDYSYSIEEAAYLREQIDSRTEACFEGMTATDDYGKAKYLHDYIITHTDYCDDAAAGQDIVSALVNGSSVCNGYAKAVQYLYTRAGINCAYVVGNTLTGGGAHAWNVCCIDGEWYQLDVTWDDPKGATAEAPLSYAYFLVTDDEMYRTHAAGGDYPYTPEICTATAANYYVREDRFFFSYDAGRIDAAIKQAVAAGDRYISVKFADETAFADAVRALIDKKTVHRMINSAYGIDPGEGRTVYYSTDESMYIITVRW